MARPKKPKDIAVKAVECRQLAVDNDPPTASRPPNVPAPGPVVEAPGEAGGVVVNEAATVNKAAEKVDGIVDGVVEISNGVDAEPARTMADDLNDIAAAAFGSAPGANALPGLIFDNALAALELEAENHPQGRQGCMIFDPPRELPLAIVELVDDGVWKRCDFSAMWQFWIKNGAVAKAVRTDMIHLREAPENVRELAA